MQNNNERVAVLGSTGQVGASLITELSKYYNIDGFNSKNFTLPLDKDQIKHKLSKYSIIINTIGYTVRYSTEETNNPQKNLNYEYLKPLVDYCRESNKLLVHFSTNAVYSVNNVLPSKEQDPLEDKNDIPYNYFKALIDKYIIDNLKEYIIIRGYAIHGKVVKNPYHNVITSIIKYGAKDGLTLLKGINIQFISVHLISIYLKKLLDLGKYGAYNISTDICLRKELISYVLNYFGKDNLVPKIKEVDTFIGKKAEGRTINCDKIQEITNIPMVPWQEDLKYWLDNELSNLNKNEILEALEKIEKIS